MNEFSGFFNHRRVVCITPLLLLFIFGFSACRKSQPDPEITAITDETARQDAEALKDQLSLNLPDDMEISLWASEKLLGDPIAIHMDHFGRAWVTITNRSRSSEFDVRDVDPSWQMESIKWSSVEDRRDFLHRVLAPELSEENTWLPDLNNDGMHDWRDLTVQKEEVYRIEDLTGNGLANESRLFIRDFNDEVTDVAGAVMHFNEEVFLGVGPDMWRIRDTNGDGMGDWKESISHGYNVHMGFSGHGMSGLTVGPDGRVYWSIGDMGFNVVDQDGKRWFHPNEGGIFRSDPDGSNFEVFATGLRNTHEFVFDKYGNLITVDNDGDHRGEFERLVYLINGSDSGWRINWQFGKYTDPKNNDYKVWMDEEYYKPRFEDQSAHILPPLSEYHSGPAGMAYHPGTALNEKWRDHFFIVSFRGSPVRSALFAFTLKENGASFELDTDQMLTDGILPVGIDFGPDGALYMADWVETWRTTGQGRILKLDTPESSGSGIREETRMLLAENFNDYQGEALLELMRHQDMRVRQKAQFELAARDDSQTLISAIENRDHQLRRIHGIWGLAQIGRRQPESVSPLINFLGDQDAEIRAQAARWLGDVRYEPASESLIPLLMDDHPRVRFFAAEALGRMGARSAMEPLVRMLQDNDDEDVYLRQAGAIALSRIGDAEAVSNLASHPSRAVRVAAVVALKRMENPGVARFLQDEDEYIVTNAARAINDDILIRDAVPDLAAMLGQPPFMNEALIRRSINAQVYSGTAADAERLAVFASKKDMPAELRVEALEALSWWPESSEYDRVTGWYRGMVKNDADDARRALGMVAGELLTDIQTNVQISAVRTAGRLQYQPAITGMLGLLHSTSDPGLIMAVVETLRDMQYQRMDEIVAAALRDERLPVRMHALGIIAELNLADETTVDLLGSILQDGEVEEKQNALLVLGAIGGRAANDVLDQQFEKLLANTLPAEIQLELMEAVERSGNESLVRKLQNYRTAASRENIVAQYNETLRGGNVDRGQRIFYSDAGGQCIRCHAVNEEGGDVGPGLSEVGSRLSREQLLQALVDPTALVTPGYSMVTLRLQNGETVFGVLQEQTGEYTTVLAGGQIRKISNADIVEQTNATSAMPPMGGILSRRELRDLVEYLNTLK